MCNSHNPLLAPMGEPLSHILSPTNSVGRCRTCTEVSHPWALSRGNEQFCTFLIFPVIPVLGVEITVIASLRFAIESTDSYIGEIGGVEPQVDTQITSGT